MIDDKDLEKFPSCALLKKAQLNEIGKKKEDRNWRMIDSKVAQKCIKEIVETVDIASSIMQNLNFGKWDAILKGKESPLASFAFDLKRMDDEFYRYIDFDPMRSKLP